VSASCPRAAGKALRLVEGMGSLRLEFVAWINIPANGIICWGLYPSRRSAVKAWPSLPDFTNSPAEVAISLQQRTCPLGMSRHGGVVAIPWNPRAKAPSSSALSAKRLLVSGYPETTVAALTASYQPTAQVSPCVYDAKTLGTALAAHKATPLVVWLERTMIVHLPHPLQIRRSKPSAGTRPFLGP
jgi:hypothetical protein